MGSKRKPESPLRSEPSSKIRRIDKNLENHENFQYAPAVYSPPTQQDRVLAPSETTPAPLTKANLRQLEKMTNTGSGSGSRSGKSVSSSKTGQSSTTSVSGGGKSLSTTDPHFEENFRRNGGLSIMQSAKNPPSNEKEIKEYLDKSRGSASPTSSQHEKFLTILEKASNERDIENLMQRRVLRDTNYTDELVDQDYGAYVDKQWVAFPKNVGFNNGLSAPKPDLTEGFAQRAFTPSVQQLGGAATLVHDSSTFACLPHFVGEFKDHGKSMREAEVQAGYDAAHMVYARDKTLEFVGDKEPARRASPITVASDGHYWTVYSHYAHDNDEKKMREYYQNEIASGKTIQFDDFKRGFKVLRNAQDWGRKESDDLRGRIKEHDDRKANQARSGSRAGSAAGSNAGSSLAGSSAYPPARGGAFQPPQRRASDASSRRSDGQASSSSTRSVGRPSMTGYAGTSRLAGSPPIAPPPLSKTMLPPPSKSISAGGRAADTSRASARSPSASRYPPSAGSGAPRSPSRSSSAGRVADPRDTRGSIRSPSHSRYPPSASSAGSGAPRSPSGSGSARGRAADTSRGSVRSPSTSRYPPSASSTGHGAAQSPSTPGSAGGRVADPRGSVRRSPSASRYPPSANCAGSGAPRPPRSPSVSSVPRDSRAAGDRRPSGLSSSRDSRASRNRRPSVSSRRDDPDDIQPVQRRRSDSPKDEPRDRDRDRGRYRDRDDRR